MISTSLPFHWLQTLFNRNFASISVLRQYVWSSEAWAFEACLLWWKLGVKNSCSIARFPCGCAAFLIWSWFDVNRWTFEELWAENDFHICFPSDLNFWTTDFTFAPLVTLVLYYVCTKLYRNLNGFYPRDAMLARVKAIATCLSVCLSVRPSVTRRYCVKTNWSNFGRLSRRAGLSAIWAIAGLSCNNVFV